MDPWLNHFPHTYLHRQRALNRPISLLRLGVRILLVQISKGQNQGVDSGSQAYLGNRTVRDLLSSLVFSTLRASPFRKSFFDWLGCVVARLTAA